MDWEQIGQLSLSVIQLWAPLACQVDWRFPRAHLPVVWMLRFMSLTYTNRACPFLLLYLISVSVFMALSTIFHSINSPDNFPLSHSVLQSYFCLIGPFNYIYLSKSLPKWFQRLGAFAVRCDPCRGRKGSWRARHPLAEICWVQHISLARTSLRRVVGLVRPNQSAGRAEPLSRD